MESSSQGTFSDLLKMYRKQKRITQRQLASKLDVHYNTIWAWEQGDHLPETRGMVLEVAKHLRLNDLERRHLLEASLMSLSTYWHIPYPRNRFFTGREEILTRLHDMLGQEKAVKQAQSLALSGLGGMGKTQIALEYAYQYAQEYAAIFWIASETSESILSSCTAIAHILNLTELHDSDQQKLIDAVSRWLTTHRDWLLIMDNVEEIALMKNFLPAARNGSLVLTTRMQALGGLAPVLGLERMTTEEGISLLLRWTHQSTSLEHLDRVSEQEKEQARNIVEMLDGLPLALDQAGAYIDETQCSLEEYLQLYQTYPLPLLNERDAHTNHPISVARTFALTFERLQPHNPVAVDLLYMCAFLAPDAIPERLLLEGAFWLGPTLQALVVDRRQYYAVIKDLLVYSLIHRNAEAKTLTIHRLVQDVLKDTMAPEVKKAWASHVVLAVNQVFPAGILTQLTQEQWTWCGQILPHAFACVNLSVQWNDALPDVSLLLMKTANYLRDRAQYPEAEPLYLRALALCEQQLGSFHPTTAINLNHLGLLYEYQGKDKQAEPLYQRALLICEQKLGAFHPDTAQSLNTLAALYHSQKRYAEAEPLYQQALMICEHVCGPEHPDTAQSLNNLAVLYGQQGRYAEAETFFLRTLVIREQVLGAVHPSIAATCNNLATLYRKQGKYECAEPLYLRSLAICENHIGKEHPNTATCLNNLAQLYQEQGKYEQAEWLFQRALSIREQKLGPSHPDTDQTLTNIMLLYKSQRRYKEALFLLQQALHSIQQVLSSTHPQIINISQDIIEFTKLAESLEADKK